MKTLEVTANGRSLEELLDMAGEENVVLTMSDGRQFVLAEIDDFEAEVKLVREQDELMAFLDSRSDAGKTLTLTEVKEALHL